MSLDDQLWRTVYKARSLHWTVNLPLFEAALAKQQKEEQAGKKEAVLLSWRYLFLQRWRLDSNWLACRGQKRHLIGHAEGIQASAINEVYRLYFLSVSQVFTAYNSTGTRLFPVPGIIRSRFGTDAPADVFELWMGIISRYCAYNSTLPGYFPAPVMLKLLNGYLTHLHDAVHPTNEYMCTRRIWKRVNSCDSSLGTVILFYRCGSTSDGSLVAQRITLPSFGIDKVATVCRYCVDTRRPSMQLHCTKERW